MDIRTICGLAPVVPVLIVDDVAQAAPLARALVAGGLKALEVTLPAPAVSQWPEPAETPLPWIAQSPPDPERQGPRGSILSLGVPERAPIEALVIDEVVDSIPLEDTVAGLALMRRRQD